MTRFIFMLTRNDETVSEARSLVGSIENAGVAHVGCKDVGLGFAELEGLFDDLRAAGCATYLEVVSETPASILGSARAALRLRPDYLIGGTSIEPVRDLIAGSGIRFYPYIGRVVGHPSLLRGTIPEVVADARRAEAAGVDGINLLAYRYDGDVEGLVAAVTDAVAIPVICAGSIDSYERIDAMRDLRVWGFTIGTAVLDGAIGPELMLEERLAAVVARAAGRPMPGRDRDADTARTARHTPQQ